MPDLPDVTWQALLLGLAALAFAIVLSQVLRFLTAHFLLWRGRSKSAAKVFSEVVAGVTIFLGFGAMLVIIFPSIRPVNILGGVGIVSIAAGIAFQTVLGNMFAGLVILAKDVYRVDDQIAVGEFRGSVTEITLNATRIRTFDGRAVLIPNGIIHSSELTVQTGYEQVRSRVDIDIDDTDDLERARTVAVRTMRDLPGVATSPPPEAFYRAVGQDAVTLELRFWSGSLQLETRAAQDTVIRAVLAAYRAEGIRTAQRRVHIGELFLEQPDASGDDTTEG